MYSVVRSTGFGASVIASTPIAIGGPPPRAARTGAGIASAGGHTSNQPR